MLKATFFGVPQIQYTHQEFTEGLTKRALALFAYLALADQPQDRGHLADLLWSDIGEQQARQNLRYVLYELRKSLGDYLVITRHALAFLPQKPFWIDAKIFTAYLAQAETVTDSALLQNVLQLYQGEFMAGFSLHNAPGFEEWLLQQRQQFHQHTIQGLLRLGEQYLAYGDYANGLVVTRRLLQLAPWQEEAHRLQMRFLAHNGQRLDALTQYATCCQILQAEFGIAPEGRTTELFRAIEAGELTMVAGARRPELPPALQVNWDAVPQTSRIVGRQAELVQLHHWVTETPTRVIGLFGLAGQGKSTLGAELVAQIAEEIAAAHHPSAHAFEVIIWSTLTTLPGLTHLMEEWLAHLCKPADLASIHMPSPGQPASVALPHLPPKNLEALLQDLLVQLRRRRVLLIIDGGEQLYGSSGPWGEYQAGWEAFDELLRRLADNAHKGCLLFLSRITPATWEPLARRCSALRTMILSGLTPEASVALLKAIGSTNELPLLQMLVDRCVAHPQTLVAVRDLLHTFGDELLNFLAEPFLGKIFLRVLHAHFTRFTSMEQAILLHLTDASTPQTTVTLWQQLENTGTRIVYLEALLTLQSHHWLLPSASGEPLLLPPLIKRFVEQYGLALLMQKNGDSLLPLLTQGSTQGPTQQQSHSGQTEPARQPRLEIGKPEAAPPSVSFSAASHALSYVRANSDKRTLPT